MQPRDATTFTLRYEFSRPPKNVKWTKDGSEPKDMDRIKATIDGCEVTLIVEKSSRNDSGVYTLQADDLNLRTLVKVQCMYN
jgi:hypothetical protein